MFTDDKNAYRMAFVTAWHKYHKHLPLEPYEQQIIDVIVLHPEYQALLDSINKATDDYALAENPFFHMSLHIAILEQLKHNRPAGIDQIYQQLQTQYNPHDAQHAMMEVLANYMWHCQQQGIAMNEQEYIKRLQILLTK